VELEMLVAQEALAVAVVAVQLQIPVLVELVHFLVGVLVRL
jgi:hypothetical protein